MNKATYTYTAGDGVLPQPPTILQLGVLLADTTSRLEKHGIDVDGTILTLAGSLRHVMASMPAQTLQDAAAQLGAAYVMIDSHNGCTHEEYDDYVKELAASVRLALISALPLVAEASGVGIGRSWAGLRCRVQGQAVCWRGGSGMTQTPEKPTGSDISIPDIAKMKFEAVGLTATDLMPLSEFLTHSKVAYCYLRLGIDILNKTPEELAAAFQESVDKDASGMTMLEGISCFNDVADWCNGFSQVLETVVARSYVAASVIAERQSK